MNEIFEAVSARIKAPYFGYSLLAFFGMNWRGLFLLAFTEGTPEIRMAAFDGTTSVWSLIVVPLLFGALVTAATPWVRVFFAWLSRSPFERLDIMQLVSEQRRTIKKAQLDKAISEAGAAQEEELIARARRDAEIAAEIKNDEIRKNLMDQLEAARRERDELSKRIGGESPQVALSSLEWQILMAAVESESNLIHLSAKGNKVSLRSGGKEFLSDGGKSALEISNSVGSLANKGLVVPVAGKENLFHVSRSGFNLIRGRNGPGQ
jgi:hypothetical protein